MVIDANILAAYYLEDGERHLRVRALLRDLPNWYAPRIWRSEYYSVLRKYILFRALPKGLAALTLLEAEHQLLEVPPAEPLLVLDLIVGTRLSSYDCEYVAAAMTTGSSLVTFDKALLGAFPRIAREP